MKKFQLLSVKWLSTIITATAIAVELWQIYAGLMNESVFPWLITISWGGRLVIAIHFIEALIACGYAPSKQKSRISYGIYTFFVGTVGLVELFETVQSDS